MCCGLKSVLREWLEFALPDDAHERCTSRLTIIMRALRNLQLVSMSNFESRDQLIDMLVASCSIPFVTTPTKVDGRYYIDACTAQGKNAIPSVTVLLPPSKKQCEAMFKAGLANKRIT